MSLDQRWAGRSHEGGGGDEDGLPGSHRSEGPLSPGESEST